MSLFADYGIAHVPHYAPLHYAPFILRDEHLRSKPSLREQGFEDHHFRSKSAPHDQARGFGDYAFLTLDMSPRILGAKLKGGFPHFALEIPETSFDGIEFHLCRFNVAMTRYLRRGGKPGFAPGNGNGSYYDNKEIPSAQSEEEKREMLEKFHGDPSVMIEVLVTGALPIPNNARLVCFHDQDVKLITQILDRLNCPRYEVLLSDTLIYTPKPTHKNAVTAFIETALDDSDWRGDGLEFDKV